MASFRLGSWPGRGGVRNPFIDIFADAVEAEGCAFVSVNSLYDADPRAVDGLVFHWPQFMLSGSAPHQAYTVMKVARRLDAFRAAGARIVWMLHDLDPHDMRGGAATFIWRWMTAQLARRIDGYVTLSPGTYDHVARASGPFAGLPGAAAWHPAYDGVRLSAEARAAARAAVGAPAEAKVIGCFGEVLRYKGMDDLLALFLAMDDPELRLVMGGAPDAAPDLAASLRNDGAADPRTRFVFERLSNERYRDLVGACDLCVFPYRKYTHSGAMIYALSAGRAILTPRTPFSQSLAEAAADGAVMLYDGSLTAEVLRDAAHAAAPTPPLDPALFAPAGLARAVIGLLRPQTSSAAA